MAPATVGAVLDRIAATWTLSPDVEVTLEANPASAEVARFRDLRAARFIGWANSNLHHLHCLLSYIHTYA